MIKKKNTKNFRAVTCPAVTVRGSKGPQVLRFTTKRKWEALSYGGTSLTSEAVNPRIVGDRFNTGFFETLGKAVRPRMAKDLP